MAKTDESSEYQNVVKVMIARKKKEIAESAGPYRIQSIERAIEILNCFSFQHKERSLSDIIAHTGLNRSTANRFVRNLEFHGFLQKDPDTRNYRLGIRLFELGGIVSSSFSLHHAMARPMAQLTENVDGATLVALKINDHFVLTDKSEKHGLVSMPSEIGMKKPLTFGTIGRVFLAHMPEAEINEILEKYPLKNYTPNSITDPYNYFLELEKIRKNGYSIDVEEYTEGIMAVAAPVMDHSRKVVAALCIGSPASKSKDQAYVKETVALVTKAAQSIAYNLGYIPA